MAGRLVVHKRVSDPAHPVRRYQRRGFRFQLLDDHGQPVGDELATDSTGRAVFDGELALGRSYTLRETFAPVEVEAPAVVHFTMDASHKLVIIASTVSRPDAPYGG